jgi:hypothetical protein
VPASEDGAPVQDANATTAPDHRAAQPGAKSSEIAGRPIDRDGVLFVVPFVAGPPLAYSPGRFDSIRPGVSHLRCVACPCSTKSRIQSRHGARPCFVGIARLSGGKPPLYPSRRTVARSRIRPFTLQDLSKSLGKSTPNLIYSPANKFISQEILLATAIPIGHCIPLHTTPELR